MLPLVLINQLSMKLLFFTGAILALSAFVAVSKKTNYQYIDVSHVIEDGMITYKGIQPPVITPTTTREQSRSHYTNGTEFYIAKIEMAANTGTYIDSPFHRYPEGDDLSELKLENLVDLEAILVNVDISKGRAIDKSIFEKLNLSGKALVIHTGWDKHWRTEEYFSGHPYLTKSAVEFISTSGCKLVAIDTYNIDDTRDGDRPAHSVLLKAGIPIIEHICNLHTIPNNKVLEFTAVPIKIKDFSTFPVRAYVKVKL